jgi:endogenous inhibitor of DNA gyrase (YacG/DUF329 family)
MTGHCAVCGQAFTTQPHQRPPRRYCSIRCRKIAWRHRHHIPQRPVGAVPRPSDVPGTDNNHRPGDVPDVPSRSEPQVCCPHCARPVAVITLLVAPAAAQVTTPGTHYDR